MFSLFAILAGLLTYLLKDKILDYSDNKQTKGTRISRKIRNARIIGISIFMILYGLAGYFLNK